MGGAVLQRHKERHAFLVPTYYVEVFLFGLLSMCFIDTQPSRSPCDASAQRPRLVGLTHINDTRHDKKCPSFYSPAQPQVVNWERGGS